MTSRFPPSLREAVAHCLAEAPREGVGAYLLEKGRWAFHPLVNVAPGRLAFELDAREWIRLERRAAERVCLVHSHVDGPATLSARDRAAFTPAGRPLLRGLTLVVLALRGPAVVEAAGYDFDREWRPVRRFDTLALQSHSDLH